MIRAHCRTYQGRAMNLNTRYGLLLSLRRHNMNMRLHIYGMSSVSCCDAKFRRF